MTHILKAGGLVGLWQLGWITAYIDTVTIGAGDPDTFLALLSIFSIWGGLTLLVILLLAGLGFEKWPPTLWAAAVLIIAFGCFFSDWLPGMFWIAFAATAVMAFAASALLQPREFEGVLARILVGAFALCMVVVGGVLVLRYLSLGMGGAGGFGFSAMLMIYALFMFVAAVLGVATTASFPRPKELERA